MQKGLTVNHERSVRSADRDTFRVYASDEHTCAVALFCDTQGAARVTQPRSKEVLRRIRVADEEIFDERRCGKRFCLALLRSDTHQNVLAVVAHLIDEQNHNDRQSRIMHLQMWHVNELQYDVMAHKLVQPHRRATADEVTRFATHHLPLMLEQDVVARWMLFEEGHVVRIEQNDARLGTAPYFRLVVRQSTHPAKLAAMAAEKAAAAATAASSKKRKHRS